MAGITISASGGGQERLRRIRTVGLGRALKEFGGVSNNTVGNRLRSEAPERTGHFRSTIRGRVSFMGDRVTIKFDAEQPLATFIIKGTKAHIIVGNPVLKWEEGGIVHFAASVNHPGTKANPFHERAIRQVKTELVNMLAQSVKANWQ